VTFRRFLPELSITGYILLVLNLHSNVDIISMVLFYGKSSKNFLKKFTFVNFWRKTRPGIDSPMYGIGSPSPKKYKDTHRYLSTPTPKNYELLILLSTWSGQFGRLSGQRGWVVSHGILVIAPVSWFWGLGFWGLGTGLVNLGGRSLQKRVGNLSYPLQTPLRLLFCFEGFPPS